MDGLPRSFNFSVLQPPIPTGCKIAGTYARASQRLVSSRGSSFEVGTVIVSGKRR